MQSEHIATITISIIAIIISGGLSGWTFWRNHVFQKHKKFLENKKIIIKDFIRHGNEFLTFEQIPNVAITDLLIIDLNKKKVSLNSSLTLFLSLLTTEKNGLKNSIYRCTSCLNFYNSESFKIIYAIYSHEWYGFHIKNKIILEFNNLNNLNINQTAHFNYFNQKSREIGEKYGEWKNNYLTYFINVFYPKNSFQEFKNITSWNEEKFKIEDLLLVKNKTQINLEIKNIIQYIEKFLKNIDEKFFTQQINNFSNSSNNLIINNNMKIFNYWLERTKEILKQYEHFNPLSENYVVKNKKKIRFTFSKCHFCIFLGWGLDTTFKF